MNELKPQTKYSLDAEHRNVPLELIHNPGDTKMILADPGNKNNDPINHPYHYASGGVECWDAMRAARGDEAHIEYCIQTAIKYLYRCGKKGGLLEDAMKAQAFLNRAVKILSKEI